MLLKTLENIALDNLLENVITPAVQALKADPRKLRLLVQSRANRSRVTLNGERFRYVVRNNEHILTSERKVHNTTLNACVPALTLKYSDNVVVCANGVSGSNGRTNSAVANRLFTELTEVAFAK